MNFYKRHIGDYLKDTAHLSLLEHGIYSRLLDVYYTREGAIPEAQAARLIGARTKEELAALRIVLDEFFVRVGDDWQQPRCEREIAAANEKADTNRENGKRGGRPKKETQSVSGNNPDGFRNESDQSTKSLSEKNLSQTPLAISNSESNDSGRKPPDPIFGTGLAFLVGKGLDQKLARSFLGKLRKDSNNDDLRVLRAIERAKAEDISDPIPWLTKALAPSAAPERKPWN